MTWHKTWQSEADWLLNGRWEADRARAPAGDTPSEGTLQWSTSSNQPSLLVAHSTMNSQGLTHRVLHPQDPVTSLGVFIQWSWTVQIYWHIWKFSFSSCFPLMYFSIWNIKSSVLEIYFTSFRSSDHTVIKLLSFPNFLPYLF